MQIHAKVDIGPVNALSDVFFLFKHKHVLVEELLKLFIAEVDTDLFKAIVVKDLKTSNVKTTNVVNLLHGGINDGLITFVNNETEDKLVDLTANTWNWTGSTSARQTLGNPLSTNLQFWFAEIGDHPFRINAADIGNLLGIGVILHFSLLILANWDKVLGKISHVHDNSG